MAQTTTRIRIRSNWKRKLTKQEKTICRQTKAKIVKKQETKNGLTSQEITILLAKISHFGGCYAEDQLDFSVTSFPFYIVVNLDNSNQPGSHWIAVRIDRQTVEVFDPAGFQIFKWPRIPCTLLSFLHRKTVSRKLHLSPPIQHNTSTLCGFYCIFYIIMRQHYSLSKILSLFSSNLSQNDRRLLNLF